MSKEQTTAPQFTQAFVDEVSEATGFPFGDASDCTFWAVDSDTTERIRLATEDETRASFIDGARGGQGHITCEDASCGRAYVEVA